MKSFIITLGLISTLLFACVSAINTKNEIIDVEVKNGNSLLWSIEKEGQPKSYLFGTMHMIELEYYNFSNKLKSRILSSDKVIMEIAGTPNPIEAFNLMVLDSGSVEDFFTKEQLATIVEFMDKKLNISPKQFRERYSKMKPFLILQTLTQAYFSDSATSYDLQIIQLAKENNIGIEGFETMEEQLAFFDEIPDYKMAELIVTSIKNFEKEKKETIKLQKLYAKEKVNKLIPLMKKQSPEFMAYEDIFLSNRNKKWISKIIKFTKKHRCFIAVGAAHLFGENGVINLLKQNGFKLTPIYK